MRVCRECKKDETKVVFKRKDNFCATCNSAYMVEYRERNKTKISKQIQTWKDVNRGQHRATCRASYATPEGKAGLMARSTKNPRVWLAKCLSSIKCKCEKPREHHAKDGPRRDFQIDIELVCALYEKQRGLCALTGLRMSHRPNNPKSASIDRIDGNLGYLPSNVQIVCQFANLAKRSTPNDVMLAVFQEMSKLELKKLDKLQG